MLRKLTIASNDLIEPGASLRMSRAHGYLCLPNWSVKFRINDATAGTSAIIFLNLASLFGTIAMNSESNASFNSKLWSRKRNSQLSDKARNFPSLNGKSRTMKPRPAF